MRTPRFPEQFLNAYKRYEGLNGVGQMQIGSSLLFISVSYVFLCRLQRS